MTTLSPTPEAIIQLAQCRCAKERRSMNHCQCRKAGLLCTDLCSCYDDDDDKCENQPGDCDDDDSDFEDKEDDDDVLNQIW